MTSGHNCAAQILNAELFILATPIWLGHPSSYAQRVLERLDSFLGEQDDRDQMATVDRVALVAVTGNEDGAHHVGAELFQGLNDVGFTVAASAMTYWVGEAMHATDLKDLPSIPKDTANATPPHGHQCGAPGPGPGRRSVSVPGHLNGPQAERAQDARPSRNWAKPPGVRPTRRPLVVTMTSSTPNSVAPRSCRRPQLLVFAHWHGQEAAELLPEFASHSEVGAVHVTMTDTTAVATLGCTRSPADLDRQLAVDLHEAGHTVQPLPRPSQLCDEPVVSDRRVGVGRREPHLRDRPPGGSDCRGARRLAGSPGRRRVDFDHMSAHCRRRRRERVLGEPQRLVAAAVCCDDDRDRQTAKRNCCPYRGEACIDAEGFVASRDPDRDCGGHHRRTNPSSRKSAST